MGKKRSFGISLITILFLLLFQKPFTPPPSPITHANNSSISQQATILKVVDGDTIHVMILGKKETVRIIGINTPETVDPRRPVECFGNEASDKAKQLLENQMVFLETDPTQGDKDKYQRLLRYVRYDNGTKDFGAEMISTGYAYEYTYNTPYKNQVSYKELQKRAEKDNRGLWSSTTCKK